ncbi:streptomycin 6-kinase [Haloactinospora alba]|uniref:Streptomycin 6-kinase n=1 Tax=Haloactinospora alba TaxID=405555 RepID=A0A543N759_9ACTN|nr:aminoglycoside phosphotransferase family protein [Haloactinospora alba]TQN27671.1 streptomycin 6-kinase [Haloactinospora alba]
MTRPTILPPQEHPAPPPPAVQETVAALPGGPAWLEELESTVLGLRDRWGLRLGRPFQGGSCSWVAPVATASGRRAVLKVAYPHREGRGEARALRFWGGDGAVRLYESAEDGFAMLMEACEPGGRMSEAEGSPEELLAAGAHTLSGLWKHDPGGSLGMEFLADVTVEWAAATRGYMEYHRPGFDPYLVEAGAALLETLPATSERAAVVHGDANPGNILEAGGGQWLAIDPKPMVGDPAYDLWPLVMQVEPPLDHSDPHRVLRHRFGLASGILGEPEERLVAWAFARAVESSLDLVNRGAREEAESEMAEAEVLADLAGV